MIREANLKDFLALKYIDHNNSDDLGSNYGQTEYTDFIQESKCYTIFNGVNIIAIFGLFEHWPETVELFMIVNEKLRLTFMFTLYKDCKKILAMFPQVIRFQATVEADNKRDEEFLFRLGFQKEGILRKYADNKDYTMLSKVK